MPSPPEVTECTFPHEQENNEEIHLEENVSAPEIEVPYCPPVEINNEEVPENLIEQP